MLSLAKLISSGLTGLSASSEGAYFIPGTLTETDDVSNVIYFTDGGEFPVDSLDRFTDTNKEILDKLSNLLKDYKDSISALVASTQKEHKSINEFFSKVQESEGKLREFYEKNKGYLEQFKEFMQQYHDTSQKKLQTEQLLQQSRYLNKSLLSLGEVISGGGLSLEKFLCAINDQEGKKQCETTTKDGLKDSTQLTGAVQVQAQGGGTTASTDALKKLQEASEKLKAEKEKLKTLFVGVGAMNFANIMRQSFLEKKHSSLSQGLLVMQELQKEFNSQIQKVSEESNKETETLNENYNKLQNSVSNGEKLKRVTSSIHQGKGSLQNAICELNPHANKVDCSFSKSS